MQLTDFRVTNFRSINDSAAVDVKKTTAIVGRNESGKSNLLLALLSLNPPGGAKPLSAIKDFPRNRRLQDCIPTTGVLETTWLLSDSESEAVGQAFPRAAAVKNITITRDYGGTRTVKFPGAAPPKFSAAEVTRVWTAAKTQLAGVSHALADPHKTTVETAFAALETAVVSGGKAKAHGTAIGGAAGKFRAAVKAASHQLTATETAGLIELETLAEEPETSAAQLDAAVKLVIGWLPLFVFLEEYPDFDGHQDIAAYQTRKANGQLTEADRNFLKLCKVAGLDPDELHKLNGANDHETRGQLANRAGAVVTTEIRRLWKDRALKVRFSPDGVHLDVLISDPNATYDVEVNLNERSRGLRWFFSFYMTFAADTQGGHAENAILLLDEPGLYLHAGSQGDLLGHLRNDLGNQVIFTTHSPFMIPVDDLAAIRTVSIDQDKGTTVTNNPTGDARTLFPLQAALGYNLAQSLFVGPRNVVVEGVTDYWYLTAVSAYLESQAKTGLPKDLTLTPAGGAQKVSYMVALLASEKLDVLVLLDKEPQAERTAEELAKSKLIRQDNIIYTAAGFAAPVPQEADIEDLLEPSVFDDLVKHTYRAELAGKNLALNLNIPRIVPRYEAAFEALGLEFHKSRPAREFLNRMASTPKAALPAAAQERFERLFAEMTARLAKHVARAAEPFR